MSNQRPTGGNWGNNYVGGSISAGSGDVVIGQGNVVRKNIHENGQPTIDVAVLKRQLEDFYDDLDTLNLSREHKRAARSAADDAIKATAEQNPQADAVVGSLQQVSQTIKEAGVQIQAGSQLATSIINIAKTIAPLVIGGAHAIAAWFGVPLP